ncbi:MAG: M48 family metallopeptidase [Candidatus Dormibacteria bacterium]
MAIFGNSSTGMPFDGDVLAGESNILHAFRSNAGGLSTAVAWSSTEERERVYQVYAHCLAGTEASPLAITAALMDAQATAEASATPGTATSAQIYWKCSEAVISALPAPLLIPTFETYVKCMEQDLNKHRALLDARTLHLKEKTKAYWEMAPKPIQKRIRRTVAVGAAGLACLGLGFAGVFGGWIALATLLVGFPSTLNAFVNTMMYLHTGGVPSGEEARARRLVRELCSELGTKEPKLTIVNTEKLKNAAAMQLMTKNVFVTVPLLRSMTDREVKAVLAHEMAHIHHHDTHINLANYWGINVAIQTFAHALSFFAGPLALTGIFGVGYWRERSADVAVAKHTDYGPDLVEALKKLGSNKSQVAPRTVMRRVGSRVRAVYSFAPHPPIWDRVQYIERISAKHQAEQKTAPARLQTTFERGGLN